MYICFVPIILPELFQNKVCSKFCESFVSANDIGSEGNSRSHKHLFPRHLRSRFWRKFAITVDVVGADPRSNRSMVARGDPDIQAFRPFKVFEPYSVLTCTLCQRSFASVHRRVIQACEISGTSCGKNRETVRVSLIREKRRRRKGRKF